MICPLAFCVILFSSNCQCVCVFVCVCVCTHSRPRIQNLQESAGSVHLKCGALASAFLQYLTNFWMGVTKITRSTLFQFEATKTMSFHHCFVPFAPQAVRRRKLQLLLCFSRLSFMGPVQQGHKMNAMLVLRSLCFENADILTVQSRSSFLRFQ
jgi:hypothetical protein